MCMNNFVFRVESSVWFWFKVGVVLRLRVVGCVEMYVNFFLNSLECGTFFFFSGVVF